MFVDTHAHLSYPEFQDDLDPVVERAVLAGVGKIVSIATDLESARQTLAIARRYPNVYAAVGLHPNEAARPGAGDLHEFRPLIADPKVVAVGETGLDYYREARTDPALQQRQKNLLRAHLELAKERTLPVVIHHRAADADLLEILRQHATGLPPARRPWGVMHCFSGTEKFAFDCLEIGLLISFTGILTFKNAAALREVARAVPLEQVMLETDAPYLAPTPHRGQRNEPGYLPLTAAVLAAVKGVSIEEVARLTSGNAQRLFRLPPTE